MCLYNSQTLSNTANPQIKHPNYKNLSVIHHSGISSRLTVRRGHRQILFWHSQCNVGNDTSGSAPRQCSYEDGFIREKRDNARHGKVCLSVWLLLCCDSFMLMLMMIPIHDFLLFFVCKSSVIYVAVPVRKRAKPVFFLKKMNEI